jgi:hypothetical protein
MKRSRNLSVFLTLSTILSACVGTDRLDDPKDASIILEENEIQLQVGQTERIDAVYHYNMWRPEPLTELQYLSLNPEIASVDLAGKVSGLTKGQTTIRITYANEVENSVAVTVVETDEEVARVVISADKNTIAVDETLQFSAVAYNLSDIEVTGSSTIWQSSNPSVASIDSDGLVSGVSDGIVQITATVDEVQSTVFVLMVGSNGKSGMFQGVGSYNANGTAILTENGGSLILEFSSDFETSFALGTFVYLANTTTGTSVRSQGLEIAEVKSNGAKEYNISAIDSQVGVNTYQYVVLLCKPASITFGFAELK